ncbi:MAG: hypothetical protein Q6353_020450, partial [Candidatus Sigynarchaeum springense]
WIYNNTNGSVLTALLFHTTFNFAMFIFPVLDTRFGYVYILTMFVAAAALVSINLVSRKNQEQHA